MAAYKIYRCETVVGDFVLKDDTGQVVTSIDGVDGRVILNPTKEQLQEAGWREIVPPTPTAEEIARQEREQRIWALKDALAQGDYKIIKCAEAQLTGEAMPYDIEVLVAERNALRREINELEELLNI